MRSKRRQPMTSALLKSGIFATGLLALIAAPALAQRTVPSTGSGNSASTASEWDSKWNLFTWRGKTTAQVNEKIDREYAKFIGKSWNGYPAGSESQRFLWPYPGNANMMYSKWAGGSYGRVVIEAQCSAMMAAVQMNDKDTFDKLWRFTKEYMQLGGRYASSGGRAFFGWQIMLKSDGTVDLNQKNNAPAPDGEQWIAAALYMASGRWGDSSGINYRSEADGIVECMLHLEEYNNNPYDGWSNMFTDDGTGNNNNQVKFAPFDDINFTDPAYQLPAFYELFSKCGPTADRARWAKIAKKSRTYLLPRACGFNVSGTRPNNSGDMDNGTSHLPPGYSTYDGTAYYHSGEATNGTIWGPEAWRVGMNVATDYMWWGSSSNSDFTYHPQIVRGIQDWLAAQAGGWRSWNQSFPYEEYRKLNGVALYSNPESSGGTHSAGVAACNAVASLASSSDWSDEFVDELWSKASPTNDNPYSMYLYMTSLLKCGGRFRVYMPGNTQSNTNQLTNAGFESDRSYMNQTVKDWYEWNNTDCSYTEDYGGGRSGTHHLTHYKNGAFNVYTFQQKTIPNGVYSFRMWIKGGGQLNYTSLVAKQYGGSDIYQDVKSSVNSSGYTQVSINNLNVTTGKIEVGVISDSSSGAWVYFDDAELVKTG